MKKKTERLYEGLFADKIIEDGNIEMFSIYDFPNLYELTAFIEECERQNCFVTALYARHYLFVTP